MMRLARLIAAAVLLSAAPLLAKEAAPKPAAAEKAKTKAKAKLKRADPSAAKLKSETSHLVRDGETLGGVANRAAVPRVLIIEANRLKAPYALHDGQKLVIPRRRSHTVKEGETGLGIALDFGLPWRAIAQANGLSAKAEPEVGQKLVIPTLSKGAPGTAASAAKADAAPDPKASATSEPSAAEAAASAADRADTSKPPVSFGWPVSGTMRRGFIPRKNGKSDAKFHDGIDVLAAEGTAVRASAAGKVIFAGEGPKEYGQTVVIHHGGRWTTVYSYLSKITVKLGDKVKATERIGLVGQSGQASEPQLHFEVRHARNATDPLLWLPVQPAT